MFVLLEKSTNVRSKLKQFRRLFHWNKFLLALKIYWIKDTFTEILILQKILGKRAVKCVSFGDQVNVIQKNLSFENQYVFPETLTRRQYEWMKLKHPLIVFRLGKVKRV